MSGWMMNSEYLDLKGMKLDRIEPLDAPCTKVLYMQNNNVSKLSDLDGFPSLEQLFLTDNRLIHIESLEPLKHLRVLDLGGNSILHIAGLESLKCLERIDLSRNNIKSLDGLSECSQLIHVNVSYNSISKIGDLSSLRKLKTLNVQGNIISVLKNSPTLLPPSLTALLLSECNICDLNEFAFLSMLPILERVSLLNNPCVAPISIGERMNYRCFLIYWCPKLNDIDSIPVSKEELLLSKQLFRHNVMFRLGEHDKLVDYLQEMRSFPKDGTSFASSALESSTFSTQHEKKAKQDFNVRNTEKMMKSPTVTRFPARPSTYDADHITVLESTSEFVPLSEEDLENDSSLFHTRSLIDEEKGGEKRSSTKACEERDFSILRTSSVDTISVPFNQSQWPPESHEAALKIQSSWRGFRVRKTDVRIIALRKDARLDRLEKHVIRLSEYSNNLAEQLKEEQARREKVEEGLHYLWQEVAYLREKADLDVRHSQAKKMFMR